MPYYPPAASGASVSPGRLVVSGTTHFTIPGVAVSTQGTAAIVAATVRYFPIVVVAPVTVDQLTIAVTGAGAAATTARLGICAADSSWAAGALTVDGGTVAVDSTGNKSVSISTALSPGRYYLMLNSDGAPTLRAMRGSISNGLLLSTLGGSPLISTISAAQAYAAFPSTSTAATTTASGTVGFDYLVFPRLSAA